MNFRQFLLEKEKSIKLYGMNTGHSPGKLFSSVSPATPFKPKYAGLNVNKILPVPRLGKRIGE